MCINLHHLVKLYKVIWGHSRSLHLNSPSPGGTDISHSICNAIAIPENLLLEIVFKKREEKKFSLKPKQQVTASPRPAERRADRTAFSS